MNNLLVQPSKGLSIINNFLSFNSIKFQEINLWNNDLIDFGRITQNNTIVIIDVKIFQEVISVEDSITTLITFLENQNKLIVYSDIDSGIIVNNILNDIKKLDAQVPPNQIIIATDAKLLNAPLVNIKIVTTPVNWFTKNLRKTRKRRL